MKIDIVGAGIIGSYLGYRLGEQAIVFDRKRRLGGKACSGLISERIWDFIPENRKFVKHVIDEARIHFSRRVVKLLFSPKMLVFDRQKLDEYVGRLAREKGAKFVFNTEIKDVKTLGNKIIGADGANSFIRRKFSGDKPKFRLGIYCYTKQSCKDNWVDCWPISGGFAWKIPRGENVEWGVIASVKKAKQEFEKFTKNNNVKVDRKYSALIPERLCFVDRSVTVSNEAKDITLIGDAAGLTKPWSGGGVVWGMMAGDILIKNIDDFRNYEKQLNKKFFNKIILNRLMRKIILCPGVKWFIPKEIKFDGDMGI